jgi:hypothetical protein
MEFWKIWEKCGDLKINFLQKTKYNKKCNNIITIAKNIYFHNFWNFFLKKFQSYIYMFSLTKMLYTSFLTEGYIILLNNWLQTLFCIL